MEQENLEKPPEVMRHREITLPDGRYMIFYTFGDAELSAAEIDEQDKNV